MPKSPARSRLVANIAAVAMVGASTAVLLVSPVAAPQAAAAAAPGSTQRASITNEEAQSPAGGSSSAMSADGNHVVFVSTSWLDSTINPGPRSNVFVRDLRTGRTSMISRGLPPPPPSTPRFGPSKALDLSAPAKQAAQPAPVEVPADGESFDPAVSADGRYVAFATFANNIVTNASGGSKIVVCDRDPDNTGQFDVDRPGKPRYVCFGASGQIGSGTFATQPKLSADAGRIVWQQTNYSEGVFARLRTARLRINGVFGPPTEDGIRTVSSQIGDNDFIFVDDQFDPAISGDGNRIVMHGTYRQNCECDGRFHAIVSTDVSNGPEAGRVARVDIDGADAKGNPIPISRNNDEFVMRPTVSFDGTVIAFVGEQFFFDEDRNNTVSAFNQPNVYVVQVDYEKFGREVTRTDIVSRDNKGSLANGERPALSADGRYLAFVTDSPGMHDGADGSQVENSCINPPPPVIGLTGKRMLNLAAALPPQRPGQRTNCQVVVRDLIVDRERLINEDPRLPGTLVSPNQAGNAGNDNTVPSRAGSTAPSLSRDGGRIAYDSRASNLIGNDTNNSDDVFVRTLEPTLQGALDFGEVEIGQSATRTAEISEVGAGPLPIQSIAVGGVSAADYAVTGQTCQGQTLHQTGKCSVTVKFTPGAEGTRGGLLTFVIGRNRRSTVNLTGIGTAQPVPPRGAEFSASPPLNFGARTLLSNGPEQTVTVTNTGDTPLAISSVTLIGTNPADYAISSNGCQAAVAPGALCRVVVKFSPKLPGTRPAVLQFADNAAGGPHLVGLTGSGNQPSISVSPGVTTPGRVVTVTGKEFPPGKTVTVKFDGRAGQSTVTAGSDGTFRVSLLIFPKATPESRNILGTVDGFTDPLGRTQLLIVFPSVSPAEFVVRG